MEKLKKQFSTRQTMNTTDFELFHYYDFQPVNVEYHNHDFYEIYFFLSGKVSYIIEGKTYPLESGDILLTNNRELHKPLITDGKTYERFVLWIQPAYLTLLGGEDDLCQCFEVSSKQRKHLLRLDGETVQTVRRLLERMEAVTERDCFGSSVLKKAYLSELLVYLNQSYQRSNLAVEYDTIYNEKISDVIRFINENLCDDLSLDRLSQRFYVSKYHLSRQFKLYVGLTVHQYILKKRLIAAKQLLLGGASIGEAYVVSGFGDYSNFVKVFKKEFGVSPKKFMGLVKQGQVPV